MARQLAHRGPDSQGAWASRDGVAGLGFRRLAILDLSPAGNQPMHSSDGRYVLVFNGEIYNFAALRRELESKGHRFRGRSDTEVILAAIVAWGVEAAVKRLRGMFACGLWDSAERELWLFRDRLGIKPLYYGDVAHGVFAFASELKAFRVIPGFDPDLNDAALGQFFLTGYIPAPLSIYKGVHKLEPGHLLRYRPDTREATSAAYWSLAGAVERAGSATHNRLSPIAAAEQLEEHLRRAITRHMVADVPLGVFLSGGLDSSLVAALMQEHSPHPIRTFSIGFKVEGFDEAPFARQVAQFLGADHTEVYVHADEAMRTVTEIPEIYDEPFADSSQIPTLLVSRVARRSVTVALSGDGGDELFGGYLRYLYGEQIWRLIGWVPATVRSGLSRGLARLAAVHPESAAAAATAVLGRNAAGAGNSRAAKVGWVLGAASPDEIYDRLCQLGERSISVLATLPPALRQPSQRPIPARLTGAVERMSYFDLLTYLPDDILTKVDRASMAASLEARVPLLDDDVVEFAAGLQSDLKVHGNVTKYLLRRVLYKYIPRRMLDRPKAGFALPVADWLRGPLRDWCESLLCFSNQALDQDSVQELWRAHLGGRAQNHAILWAVLMFNGWLQQQRVPIPTAAAN